METITLIFSFLIFMHTSSIISESLILSTNSRWIVDPSTQKRVKLACVNLVSHPQPMIAEGLEKQPLNHTAAQIAANGFNCVRFTWATFMFTRSDHYNLTVSDSLDRFKHNLTAAKAGIAKNNPQFLNLQLREAHEAVVNELGNHNLMVVLDNHVSKPDWCCSTRDGNGFFGDEHFNPDEWLRGLAEVARRYKNNSAVVGMSLRNELRGNRRNESAEWYKYMKLGAEKVHEESPDFLVIVSGLSSASNLRFVNRKPLNVDLKNKLVYEAHWYTFGIPTSDWTTQTNKFCANMIRAARNNYLYLLKGNNSFPLFLSEFGIDQRGGNEGQNRYITCLLTEMAGEDIDSALWTFQGSYMYREGEVDMEEFYGVMNRNWTSPRNQTFVDRLQIVKQMNQGIEESTIDYNYTIFHPESGQCVHVDGESNNVSLGSCTNASRWDRHSDGGAIQLAGRPLCLTATGDGGPTGVSDDCSVNVWNYTRSSGFQLAGHVSGKGMFMCLEKDGNSSTIVTRKCLCVGDRLWDVPRCADNPQVQWFKFVLTNV